MVIKKDISSNELAGRAEGVFSALLYNRKHNEINIVRETETEVSPSLLVNCKYCSAIIFIFMGLLTISIGMITIVYPLSNIFMDLRLTMIKGLPAFDLWYKPEPEIILNVYLFNVTNSKQFSDGTDKKMKIVEVGPIVYREILTHSDVVYHEENSTMSYTAERSVEFLPERNEPDILNKRIIIPNIPLIGMASFLQDYMFTVKLAFNFMSKNDPIFLNTTIYNNLWNLTTPALDIADKYVSFLTPINNSAPLSIVYKDFKNRVNVNIGKRHGYRDFFKINTFDYSPQVPGFSGKDCFASLKNSTEGAIYGQSISKTDVLYYWRKTACRPIPLYFKEEVEIRKVTGYKYVTRSDMYDRLIKNSDTDCYKSHNNVNYPSGMSDASKCYMDLPVTISLPHFYGSNGYWNDKLEGFMPSEENHTSFATIEPISGVPLNQCARSQSNLIIPKLTGFSSKFGPFSNMAVPMIWLEYRVDKLTPSIDAMLYTLSNILPIGQYVFSVIFLLVGFWFVILSAKRFEINRRTNNSNLIYTFDNEIH